jgi:hypothetical protein
MLNRARFWCRAVSRGVTSLNTWAGWFGLTALMLSVAAGITVPVVFHVSHWVTAVIIMAAVVAVVAEGSYLEWEAADELRRKAEAELGNARRELEEGPRAAIRASATSSTSKTGLEVAIDREVQTPYPGVGRILEIEYHVTNHDPMEHQLFRGMEGNGENERTYFGPSDGQVDQEHQQFIRDAYQIEERRNREVPVPTRVRPGETVRGVYVARFAWNPRRRLPDYTLVITDGRREFRVRPRGAAESALAKPGPPPFALRYYTRKDPLAGGIVTSHFVGVANPAGQPERRARMFAESMSPYPRIRTSYGVDPAFPHAVPPESGGTPAAGLVIGPGQEQSWYIGNTLKGGDGKVNVYKFFSDTGAAWELGPHERWRISYRISCDGMPDKPFSIVIAAEGGGVVVRLEGLARTGCQGGRRW